MVKHREEAVALDEMTGDEPLAVALGVFDGVHAGHRALIERAVTAAEEIGGGVLPAALTFDPHPTAVFSPSRVPPLLGTIRERADLLRDAGARHVAIARFDRAFAALTPKEFARDILATRLRARAVVVGDDFRFGCDRAGDTAFLRAAGARYGFDVHVVPPVFVGGVPARSSAIRHLIAGGKVEEAARLLTHPYALHGEVVKGRQLGRTIGYPTANVAPADGVLVPGAGVYAADVLWRNAAYRAAVSVGDNPTIGPNLPRTVEAFILNGFNENLYGETTGVAFLRLLRPMVKFDSLDALMAQMARDVADAAQ